MRRLFGILIFSVGVAAWAQQGSAAKSPAANTQSNPNQPGSSASAPAQGSQDTGKSQNQSLTPSTPDELRFPEDDPSQPDSSSSAKPSTQPADSSPPRSDEVPIQDLGPTAGDSSSKDTPVDLGAPADDAKTHPESAKAMAHAEATSLGEGGVTEFHAWDPHKAAKDVEVGDFYYKRGNYRAAEARYRDALLYKDDDAIATFHLAECLEKMGVFDDARAQYESYLKILPHGPEAEKAEKRIARLKTETESK
jgi:tetratricopeptide (TPR) repeat protein